MNNDKVKDKVLDVIYEESTRHPHRSLGLTKKHIMNTLRRDSFDDSQSSLAIDFLKDQGWLKTRTQDKIEHYRLSDKAINKYHPSSYYQPSKNATRLTANNSIVVMGDNQGTISQTNIETSIELDKLIRVITESDLDTDAKIEAVANANTIKAQLSRKVPSKQIVSAAWHGLQVAATVGGASEILIKIGHAISTLI